ncbi:hypothetical protein AOQ84DRAFT_45993 [Glonium stellatum]|uniref:Clr5 domain-containing protein n=1 Tax=Glonium stellatum TaxID=574774 RepID=A0A8E2FC25_9PEZI|nr:hypothetical protein AOQ84DRAFT_45993 [Glonium stellatum]
MTLNWEDVWEDIREQYSVKGQPLKKVMDLMNQNHSFNASERAYRLKLNEWGLKKRKLSNKPPQAKRVKFGGTETTRISLSTASRDFSPLESDETGCSPTQTAESDHEHSPSDFAVEHNRKNSEHQIYKQLDDLSHAICNGCLAEVQHILDSIPDQSILNQEVPRECYRPRDRSRERSRDRSHQWPSGPVLHIAAGRSSVDVIQLLLKHGADIHATSFQDKYRPLHLAVLNGKPLNVEALICSGTDVNLTSKDCCSPLHLAIKNATYPSIVRILLDHGAEVNETLLSSILSTRSSNWPRARTATTKIIKMLLEKGALLSDPREAQTAFENFLEPWILSYFWYDDIDEDEKWCFAFFLSRGICVQNATKLTSCTQAGGKSLAHILLFHTPGSGLARMLIERTSLGVGETGPFILHTILESCPRKTVDHSDMPAAEMIKILLERGVDPNLTRDGFTPITRLLTKKTDLDVRACLCALFVRADPIRDHHGHVPVFEAIRNFEDPLRLTLAEMFLPKSYFWPSSLWPISESWTHYTSEDFKKSLFRYLPTDVQAHFLKAIINVSTTKALKMYTAAAGESSPSLIFDALKVRKDFDLPPFQFSQEYVEKLLSPTTQLYLPRVLPDRYSEPCIDQRESLVWHSRQSNIQTPTSSANGWRTVHRFVDPPALYNYTGP